MRTLAIGILLFMGAASGLCVQAAPAAGSARTAGAPRVERRVLVTTDIGDDPDDTVGAGGDALIHPAIEIAEAAGVGIARDYAEADFIGDEDGPGLVGAEGVEGFVDFGEDRVVAPTLHHTAAEPDGEAIDHEDFFPQRFYDLRKVETVFHRLPFLRALFPVAGDALLHLRVRTFPQISSQVEDGSRLLTEQVFGGGTFSAPCSARDESDLHTPTMGILPGTFKNDY